MCLKLPKTIRRLQTAAEILMMAHKINTFLWHRNTTTCSILFKRLYVPLVYFFVTILCVFIQKPKIKQEKNFNIIMLIEKN